MKTLESTAERALYDEQRDALAAGWSPMEDRPEETLETALRALWFTAGGEPRSATSAREGTLPTLSASQTARLRELVRRRGSGEPLAYLTERQHFLGIDLIARPQALIARRETELLASCALTRVRETCDRQGSASVIDVCTGSGNVAIALAHHEPRCMVWGSDLSAEAVDLARANASFAGVAGRAQFLVSDLFARFDDARHRGNTDVVTCNPPYIPSTRLVLLASEIRDHEPSMAFDGGALGISVIQQVFSQAWTYLRPGGWLCVEVGAGQAEPLSRRMGRHSEYEAVDVGPDADGIGRVLLARRRQPA
jgi:release factor glutamine methyltransferase